MSPAPAPAPAAEQAAVDAQPLCASTPLVHAPRALSNGHDVPDSRPHADLINGNVKVVVSESTYSMDVLSGGESDAGDTLQRQNNNNNSISSGLTAALRDGTLEPKRRGADLTYFIAKELLMTERTYKRDIELVTVSWSRRVSELAAAGGAGAGAGAEAAQALARACLALEPVALSCGALLARLDRVLAAAHAPPAHTDHTGDNDNEEPEYKKIADILYEHLSTTYEAYERYLSRCGTIVGLVESVRRCSAAARGVCGAFEASSPLPLACLLLRPPHRLLHHHGRAQELYAATGGTAAQQALELAARAAHASHEQLRHVENHAALCQLQRDIIGYDKLLIADREFIRMGCVYKHSTRGLQQRMLFLFSDVLVVCSRAGGAGGGGAGGGGQFRAHGALPLHELALAHADLPHSFVIDGEAGAAHCLIPSHRSGRPNPHQRKQRAGVRGLGARAGRGHRGRARTPRRHRHRAHALRAGDRAGRGRRAGARVLAPRRVAHARPDAPRHADAAVGVPAAQVQEVSGLAEAVGGVRAVHALLLQELARRHAARLAAAARVRRGPAGAGRRHRQGVRVQAAVQEPRILLQGRQHIHVQQVGRSSTNVYGAKRSQLVLLSKRSIII